MDNSDTFFWQTNGGGSNDNNLLQNTISIDGYMQQQQQMQQAQDSESPRSSPLVTSASSPQQIYRQNDELSNDKIKEESDMASATETGLPIGIVNPDAIEPKARSYTCRICQVTFPNKSAVTVHSRLHTDHQGKPYRCNFCGKGFSTNFYLKQHERIHSGQKPYKCPMCDNSFKQLSHVQQHVRTHTGVRPYKCHWPGCGKAFLQQSHLKSHEARHTPKPNTGVRPFKCHWPECGKSFAQLTNLKSHVARHTPGKGKGRKASVAAKKPEGIDHTEETGSPFGLMSPQNVINQAAAAANIVPGVIGDEEAEIRPFLCPGCSKLYVREATFKKHLEECKTKLQMSITATASALGIEPPPMPSAGASVEFDGGLLQVASMSGAPSNKRMRLSIVKREEPGAVTMETQMGIQQHGNSDSHAQEDCESPVTTMHDVVHVKEEVGGVETANFVSRQHLSEDSNFKLPQIIDTVSIYNVQSTAEAPLTLHNTMVLPNDDQKQHLLSVGQNHSTSNQQLGAQNLVLTTSGAQQTQSGVPLVMTHAATSSPLILSQQTAGRDSPTSDHSTINQAAIRWQWDQPVPRLNFP